MAVVVVLVDPKLIRVAGWTFRFQLFSQPGPKSFARNLSDQAVDRMQSRDSLFFVVDILLASFVRDERIDVSNVPVWEVRVDDPRFIAGVVSFGEGSERCFAFLFGQKFDLFVSAAAAKQ